MQRRRFWIPVLVTAVLLVGAGGADTCEAMALPLAPHASGHATVADSGCFPSMCPGGDTGGPFGLASLYFLSLWNSLSPPPTSLAPDPMPPEA